MGLGTPVDMNDRIAAIEGRLDAQDQVWAIVFATRRLHAAFWGLVGFSAGVFACFTALLLSL